MPIEIRELHIKATVENSQDGGASGSSSNAGNEEEPAEELIKKCVEKVLEILKDKSDR